MPINVILSPQAAVYQEIRRMQRLLEAHGVATERAWEAKAEDERRREDRLEYPGFARCWRCGATEPEVISVMDISVRGMQFRIRHPLAVGERIRVVLTLPDGRLREMDMRVRWVSPSRPGLSARVGAAIDWV